jgi:hypothetical protein
MPAPWTGLRTGPIDLRSLMTVPAASQEADPALMGEMNPEPTSTPIEGGLQNTLPTMAKGSGKSLKDQYTDELKRQQSDKSFKLMTPDQVAQIRENVSQLPEFQQQRQGLDDEAARLQMEEQAPMQLDLSPLMDFARYAAKDPNIGRGYKAPESMAERMKRLDPMREKLQDNRRDLSKALLDQMSKQKVGEFTEGSTDLSRTLLAMISQDPSLKGGKPVDPGINFKRYQDGFQMSPLAKPIIQSLSGGLADDGTQVLGVKGLAPLVGKPSWVSDKLLQSQLINMARLYPVSDTDVRQLGGDPGLVERFSAMLQRLEGQNGTFLPQDRKIIQDYLRVLGNKQMNLLKHHADLYAETAGQYYGYDLDTARRNLTSVVPQLALAPADSMVHPKGKTSNKAAPAHEEMVDVLTDTGQKRTMTRAQFNAATKAGLKGRELPK